MRMRDQQSAGPDATAASVIAEEITRVLAPHPIFAQFDRTALLETATRCGFDSFEAGATIMRQGDPGSFAYLILEGEADIFVEIPAGRIHMATVGRHSTVGELGAFTDMPRTPTVVAHSDLLVPRFAPPSLFSPPPALPVI